MMAIFYLSFVVEFVVILYAWALVIQTTIPASAARPRPPHAGDLREQMRRERVGCDS